MLDFTIQYHKLENQNIYHIWIICNVVWTRKQVSYVSPKQLYSYKSEYEFHNKEKMGDETHWFQNWAKMVCWPQFYSHRRCNTPMLYLYTLHLLSQILKFYQMMNLFTSFSKLGVHGAHIGWFNECTLTGHEMGNKGPN